MPPIIICLGRNTHTHTHTHIHTCAAERRRRRTFDINEFYISKHRHSSVTRQPARTPLLDSLIFSVKRCVLGGFEAAEPNSAECIVTLGNKMAINEMEPPTEVGECTAHLRLRSRSPAAPTRGPPAR
ncbi:hypothetical protein EVAR_51791_1 [Eumeta japonica]|uniref:Uncharacterized protein n=1 Tax=Eumeta variegata TaxID=151549 RepID=A0A4C2A4J0_EUMVA|nr:hypothetical protein EVAR_51791_1 [Eumeta japonica]